MTTDIYYKGNQAHVLKTIGPGGAAWAQAFVPARAEDLGETDQIQRDLDLTNWPKISMAETMFVYRYFAEVYRLWKTEAFVLFHRGPVDDAYTLVSPPWYTASAGHVKYDPNVKSFCTTCRIGSIELEAGNACPICEDGELVEFICVGTAHSHGAGGAYHSSTDDANELNQTGFHITFGNVDKPPFSVCPSFVTALPGYRNEKAQGIRHATGLEELFDIPFVEGGLDLIQLWLNRVAHPGLCEAMLKAGVDPDELAVGLSVDKLEDVDTSTVMTFCGSMESLGRWKDRMGEAARCLTTFKLASEAIKEAEKKAKTSRYGGYGSKKWTGGKAGTPSTPGGKTGGTGAQGGLGQTTKKTTTSLVPVSKTASGPSLVADKKFRIQRMHTGFYGMVISPQAHYPLQLIKKAEGQQTTFPRAVWAYCTSFKDSLTSSNATALALHLLMNHASTSEWFDNAPTIEEIVEEAQNSASESRQTLYSMLVRDVIDEVMNRIDDLLDRLFKSIALDARIDKLSKYVYADPTVKTVFPETSIDTVIETVIETNLSYVEAFSREDSDGVLLEWFRLTYFVVRKAAQNAGIPYRKDYQEILDQMDRLVLEMDGVLEDPDDMEDDVLLEEIAFCNKSETEATLPIYP